MGLFNVFKKKENNNWQEENKNQPIKEENDTECLSYTDKVKQRKEKYNSETNSVESHNIKIHGSVARNNLFDMNNLHFQNITKSFNKNTLNKFIVITIATTGLDAIKDEIVEICAVKYFEFKPIEKFHTYVKPKKPMTCEQEKISGITNDDVSSAPSIKEIMTDFEDYIKDIPIVCYNSNFVFKFLYVNGLNIINDKRIKIYDAISIYKKTFDKIDSLANAFMNLMKFNIISSTESNCYATAKVFEKCIYLITEDDESFFEKGN